MTIIDMPRSQQATVGQSASVHHSASHHPSPTGLSRLAIFEATSHCLREHGYDNTTIRRIAGLLSCAVGSIYRYYKDKHELLMDVTQSRLEPVAEAFEAGLDWPEALRRYIAVADREPEVYRLLFWLSPNGTPPVVQRFIDAWGRQLASPDAAIRAWAMLHGCVTAGLLPNDCLQAVERLIPASATDNAAPPRHRIVTLVKHPPSPSATPAAAGLQHANGTAARPRPVKDDAEDVCLL